MSSASSFLPCGHLASVLWCNHETLTHECRIVRKKRELLRTRCTTGAPSEEWRRVHCVGGRGRSFQAQVVPGALRGHPAPGRPLDEPALQQKGLVGILDRVRLLTDALGQRGQAHGLPAEPTAERGQDGPVDLVQTKLVHAEELQPVTCDGAVDEALAAHL